MSLDTAISDFNKTCDNNRLRVLLSLLVQTIQDQESQISELKSQIESLTSRIENPDMPEWQR